MHLGWQNNVLYHMFWTYDDLRYYISYNRLPAAHTCAQAQRNMASPAAFPNAQVQALDCL